MKTKLKLVIIIFTIIFGNMENVLGVNSPSKKVDSVYTIKKSDDKKNVVEQISTLLANPEFEINETQNIVLYFKISDGKLKVIEVKNGSTEIINYIKDRLNNEKIYLKNEMKKTYSLPIKLINYRDL